MAQPTSTDRVRLDRTPSPQRVWGKWTPYASALVAVVLLVTLGTVLVGRQLYKVTSQHAQFNTR